MGGGGDPCAVVQLERRAPRGGRGDAAGVRGDAVRGAGGRGVRGARSRVRAVRARVQWQLRPVRAGAHHHRRRREQRGAGDPVPGPAAGDLAVQGGQLRARQIRGGERDARAVDVAPERRRPGGDVGPGVDHLLDIRTGLSKETVNPSMDQKQFL